MSDINSEIGNLTSAIEHLENSFRQSFVHSTPKPDTQASAIYIEYISRKSEDREQFNSFQENCDEVGQIESENQELVVESFPFE